MFVNIGINILYVVFEMGITMCPLLRPTKDAPLIIVIVVIMATRWLLEEEQKDDFPAIIKYIYVALISIVTASCLILMFTTEFKLSDSGCKFVFYNDLIIWGGENISYELFIACAFPFILAILSRDLIYAIVKEIKKKK